MDENKRQHLVAIDYVINDCCGRCVHGQFRTLDNWGTCSRFTYQHLKHTGEERQLSINRYGLCPLYETDEGQIAALGSFRDFIQA